jgi:hypothetical protein
VTTWILALFILAVWLLALFGAVIGRSADGARRGVPEGERGGTSFLPGIPLLPLTFWGLAWVIDRFWGPWGTVTVGGAHVVFAGVILYHLGRDLRDLKELDGAS